MKVFDWILVSLNVLIVCFLQEVWNMQIYHVVFVKSLVLKWGFSTACFTDALYEKQQAIMTKDSKIAQLQAQVEASSAEKDAFFAKYEAIVKENEGEIFVWYVM